MRRQALSASGTPSGNRSFLSLLLGGVRKDAPDFFWPFQARDYYSGGNVGGILTRREDAMAVLVDSSWAGEM